MGLDPGTLALISGGVQTAGGLAGGYAQGTAMRAQGRYQRQVAHDNAAMADLQAADAERRGEYAASQRLAESTRLIAKQRVAGAGQNIDVNSGTMAQIQADTAALGAMDAEMERNNAWREAFGLRAEASGLRRAGSVAARDARFAAGQTLATAGLQGAQSMLQTAYLAQQLSGPQVNSGSPTRYAASASVKKVSQSAAKNAAKNAAKGNRR